MSTLGKNIRFVWKMWKREFGKGVGIFTSITLLFKILIPLFSIAIPSLVVYVFEMETRGYTAILYILSIMGVYILLNIIGGYLGGKLTNDLFIMRINETPYFMRKSLELSYEYISSHQGKVATEKAKEAILSGNDFGPEGFSNNLFSVIVNTILVIIFAVISAKLHPLLAVTMVLASSIRLIRDYRNHKWDMSIQDDEKALFYRRFNTEQKCLDTKLGKDVRLYNMQKWFRSKFESLHRQIYEIRCKRYDNQRHSSVVSIIMGVIRDVICYGFLLYQISNKLISVSEFVLYLGIISTISSYINQIFQSTVELLQNNIITDNYRNYIEREVPAEEDYPCHIPQQDGYRVELQDVDFAYGEEKIFEDLNLIIEEGQKLAIVGANGAGKTTLIKLISGLYRPQKGRILINGVDISQVNPKEVFSATSLVFQDVEIFANSIGENITSLVPEKIDKNRLTKVITDAGLLDTIQQLEKGYETNLTTYIDENGISLSGGQQQKLMLAKALYKDAPILILDEPTAALDPIAEAHLYEQYGNLTKNKTSIFISHRLSSTQFCNRVVFMEKGKIVQDGSHQQLMSLEGPYRRMFSAQAHYYQKEA
ncbi:ABC transporter ATP-binding protein [Tissierella sp.]|uniref:ABC transporter ATP-binding protein n=1 Tax=Tissierella sp. TaxID=41274 RepID=UPI00285F85FA|nr:ABC transporter ATP-binding protein [Tissierella sp.]MDR7856804.1 ABC transporter ATP-binding protein [Tissierella sp.]